MRAEPRQRCSSGAERLSAGGTAARGHGTDLQTGQTSSQEMSKPPPFPQSHPSNRPAQRGGKALRGLISSCSFERIFSCEGAALLVGEVAKISTNRATNPALTPGSPRSADSSRSGYPQPCR